MLEIVALYFILKQMGALAKTKGLSPGRWKVFSLISWFVGEFIGFVAGLMFFGINNLISALLVGIAGAFTGYLAIKSNLSKRPDVPTDIY